MTFEPNSSNLKGNISQPRKLTGVQPYVNQIKRNAQVHPFATANPSILFCHYLTILIDLKASLPVEHFLV